jgi:hypothetical protein
MHGGHTGSSPWWAPMHGSMHGGGADRQHVLSLRGSCMGDLKRYGRPCTASRMVIGSLSHIILQGHSIDEYTLLAWLDCTRINDGMP